MWRDRAVGLLAAATCTIQPLPTPRPTAASAVLDCLWCVFEHQIPCSRGFPKMMRGDFLHLGDALIFHSFADEFFSRIGLGADDEE